MTKKDYRTLDEGDCVRVRDSYCNADHLIRDNKLHMRG